MGLRSDDEDGRSSYQEMAQDLMRLQISAKLLSSALLALHEMRKQHDCYSRMTKCQACKRALEVEQQIRTALDGPLKEIK